MDSILLKVVLWTDWCPFWRYLEDRGVGAGPYVPWGFVNHFSLLFRNEKFRGTSFRSENTFPFQYFIHKVSTEWLLFTIYYIDHRQLNVLFGIWFSVFTLLRRGWLITSPLVTLVMLSKSSQLTVNVCLYFQYFPAVDLDGMMTNVACCLLRPLLSVGEWGKWNNGMGGMRWIAIWFNVFLPRNIKTT